MTDFPYKDLKNVFSQAARSIYKGTPLMESLRQAVNLSSDLKLAAALNEIVEKGDSTESIIGIMKMHSDVFPVGLILATEKGLNTGAVDVVWQEAVKVFSINS